MASRGIWDPAYGRAYRERRRRGERSTYVGVLSWAERLPRHVDTSAGLFGCWPWIGSHDANGYGIANRPGGRSTTAHRDVYEHLIGPIPAGLTLDHLCRNRGCVNPAHLEPVTHQENCRRATESRRLEKAAA